MNKKSILSKIGVLTAVFTLNASLFVSSNKNPQKVDAYSASSLPTTIDLNDCNEQEIRSYYSSLNSLSASERQGTNLLKNLKPILKNNQKYLSYDSTNGSIWDAYCIVDRDWNKSPASALPAAAGTYNPSTNKITNYNWGGNSSTYENPYLHALYYNRDKTVIAQAYGDHSTNTAKGINREHIWPKGAGFDTSGAGGARGDIMHLWAANGHTNNIHSNNFYGYVDTNQSYTDIGDNDTYSMCAGNLSGKSKTIKSSSNTVFEPQDSDKGDIARACFYMVARYNYYSGSDADGINSNNPNLELVNDLSSFQNSGYTSTTSTTGKLGILQDLLEWNRLDPPDEFEIHRNNLCYNNFTNNRNPFIDFPSWADAIWGTVDQNGNYNPTVTTSASPSTDPVNTISSSNTFSISTRSINLEVNETAEIYATNASGDISWSIEDSAVASLNKTSTTNNEKVTVTALKGGTTTITATSGGNNVTCTVTVTEVINYGTLTNPLSVDEASDLISFTGTTETPEPLYVKGIVASNSEFNTSYSNFDTVWLQSDDGNTEQAFKLYRLKFNDENLVDDYLSADSMVGKQVVVYGYGKIFNNAPQLTYYKNHTPAYPLLYEIGDPIPTAIELNKDAATIEVGETVTLTASLFPNNAVATIVWESSDESVATVNNGVVTGVKGGQATITVRASEYDLDAECVVTVNSAAPTPNDYLTNASSIATLHGEESSSLQSVTETLVFADALLDNAADISDIHIGEVTLDGKVGSNTNNNNPKYYSSDSTMRIYKGNTFTFTYSGNIKSISLTISSGSASSFSTDSGSYSNGTWTGEATSVTFTNTSNSTIKITDVSVTYSKQALTINSLCMRMGGLISVSDWSTINDEWPITDYGVMLFRTTEARLSTVLSVKEYFELGEENVTIIRKNSGTPGTPVNGYYDFSVQINITKVSNYNRYYCAAPFIVASGNYYFLPEIRYSINSLAAYYQTHDGCDLSSAALEYLATAH